jgi:hypothetical protein
MKDSKHSKFIKLLIVHTIIMRACQVKSRRSFETPELFLFYGIEVYK